MRTFNLRFLMLALLVAFSAIIPAASPAAANSPETCLDAFCYNDATGGGYAPYNVVDTQQ